MQHDTQPTTHASMSGQKRPEARAPGADTSSLREEVLALIEPYRSAEKGAHPFTTSELVVLAAIAL